MTQPTTEQLVAEVMKRIEQAGPGSSEPAAQAKAAPAFSGASMPEFVGTAIGDTIGLVIANVEPRLLAAMGKRIPKPYPAIGIIGARVGAGPQIMAVDEASKATNIDILSIELPRDTQGGAGHGSLIIVGANDVADARRAVEVTLKDLQRTMGDVYANSAGHIEMQYTARAGWALQKAFGVELGKAFGLIVGAPAAIGVLMSDVALKAASVDPIGYASPSEGTSTSNEVILMISGDSGSVKQAVISARAVGLAMVETLGQAPAPSLTEPYIA